MTKPRHLLEVLIERLAAELEAEGNPEILVWGVAALASRLRLPVLVGDDALPLDQKIPGAGPSYLVQLDLDEPGDFYVEGGDVLNVVDGVKSVGRAWLGLIDEMVRLHPERANDIWAAALWVVTEVATAVAGADAPVAQRTPSRRPQRTG